MDNKKDVFYLDSLNLDWVYKDNLNSLHKIFCTGDWAQSSLALGFAEEKHKDQYRRPSSLGIPYLSHPVSMANMALTLGITDDSLIAAILLHDVCEDCDTKVEELPVDDTVKELVDFLTKPGKGGDDLAYYSRLEHCAPIDACLIKVLDRISNLLEAAVGMSPEKIEQYIIETQLMYPRLLERVKDKYPDIERFCRELLVKQSNTLRVLKHYMTAK